MMMTQKEIDRIDHVFDRYDPELLQREEVAPSYWLHAAVCLGIALAMATAIWVVGS